MVWPSGVEMVPSFSTLGPIKATRPPTCSGVVGDWICAPASTVTPPVETLMTVPPSGAVPPISVGLAGEDDWESGGANSPAPVVLD